MYLRKKNTVTSLLVGVVLDDTIISHLFIPFVSCQGLDENLWISHVNQRNNSM